MFIIHFLFIVILLGGCKTLDKNRSSKTNSGKLSQQELISAGKELAQKLAGYFEEQSGANFSSPRLAILPIRNDTTAELAVEVVESSMMKEATASSMVIVQTKDRKSILQEIAFSQSGATKEEIEVGNLEVPRYLIRIEISENSEHQGQTRVFHYALQMTMSEIETQKVLFTDSVLIKKSIQRSRNQISW